MERCHACNREFGLIRHRWWDYHFCTKTCLNGFLVKRTQQLERMKEWLGSPDRDSTAESRRKGRGKINFSKSVIALQRSIAGLQLSAILLPSRAGPQHCLGFSD